ncbi:PAS domain S-box protein [Flavihumibacter profundi]|uniref:PAS domain S-box protein n=1 Tax=Flavihumibacter profundi TaxID=2716883 RepID=UPI001CC5452C|nr:PAS domain S-box protein [Flavihumibacter profundi]MBZ5857824.1 PAS domain S-box protein [Flavihumibacter profundi]
MNSNFLPDIELGVKIPFRFYCDNDSLVQYCCDNLKQQSGIFNDRSKTCTLDELLHLDNNAGNALKHVIKYQEPVCFRASVRIKKESLLPVYWTVVPGETGYNWYGFPANEKDRIEGRLRELELIVSSFHDVVFELGATGEFLNFWVRDPDKLFIPPAAFLGKNIFEIIQEYFTPLAGLFTGALKESIATGTNNIVEYQLPGLPEWFNCRFTMVKNPESQIVGMLVIITDITAQKKLEINLRQSEERHRDLFENANDIIYIIDTASRITSMNKMAEELLGFTESEMIGKSSHLFFAPEKLAAAQLQGDLKRNGKVKTTLYESEFISRSGTRIPVEISSRIIYKDNLPIGIHVTARDISLQKKSQQELAKSEARFRFLSEYSRDMVCLHRPNGDYVYVSAASKYMLGYDPEELIDKSPYDFFHPDDAETAVRDAHNKNSEGLKTPSVQYRYLKKDGEYVWLESMSQPILEEGEIIYIQTNTRDISDRKSAEQQLVEKDRLSSALAQASRILLERNNLLEGLEDCFPVLGNAVRSECLFVLKYNVEEPELYHIWCENTPCSVIDRRHQFLRSSVLIGDADSYKPGQFFEFQKATVVDPEIRQWMVDLDYQSLLLIPVVTSDGFWGLLGCGQKKQARTWSKTITDSLTTFASSMSSVLDKNLRDKQLKDSEERFKALFQNSLDIVFVVDELARITFATPSLQKILGYDETELMQEFCRSIVHPEERDLFNEALNKMATGQQEDLVLPLRVMHRNGNWVWMELKGQSKLGNPNINGIILSLRDITEYIEIEKTLKQYSRKITGMLNSITDGFIALDMDFNISMFNTVAEELLNYNLKLIVGGNALELLPDAGDAIDYTPLIKAVTEKKTIRFERFVPSLNRWFDVSAFPYDEGIFVYFKDATERKHRENLLQLEKEVLEMHTGSSATLPAIADHLLSGLELLSENMRCAICLVKNNLREAICISAPGLPPVFRELVESTPLVPKFTICGRAILSRSLVMIPDIEKSDLAEVTRNAARSLGIKAAWSIPIISSTNEILGTFAVYFMEARKPHPEEIAMISRAAHILTMIVENKQSAEKLRISNERYLLATRAANEAIWDWDAEEKVSFWGEGFNTLFGYPSRHYSSESQNWENKVHPEDRERVISNIAKFVSGEKRGQFTEEYRLLKADGTYAMVIDKGYCLYDNQGKVIRMVGSVEDITERKKMEEQLLQQEIHKHQQIAQAVVDVQENERAEIGKELHDNINQLLTTAKLFLEVAENNQDMRAQMIRRSSDTIMGAINEIRKISRSLMPASISDLGLISSVNDLVQNIAIARQLVVDFRYDANLDKLLHPKQKLMLFRIIQEQVNNVLKHAQASSLVIAISYMPKKTRLEIADNGIGFDLGIAKMKDGVGLSNIMSRAAIFNADVQVITSPGKGCQLIIDLPNTPKNTVPHE